MESGIEGREVPEKFYCLSCRAKQPAGDLTIKTSLFKSKGALDKKNGARKPKKEMIRDSWNGVCRGINKVGQVCGHKIHQFASSLKPIVNPPPPSPVSDPVPVPISVPVPVPMEEEKKN